MNKAATVPACAKTVIDFTSMTDDQVKFFLLGRQQEKNTCGRFRNDQLQRITITLPQHIFQTHLPLWKQFLTACLLAFSGMLFSCNTTVTTGDIIAIDTSVTTLPTRQDSSSLSLGAPAFLIDTFAAPSIRFMAVKPVITQGDISIVPFPAPVEETCQDPVEPLITVDTAYSSKTKNPPAADSINCDDMQYY